MNKTEQQKGVISIEDVQQRIVQVREQPVIIDAQPSEFMPTRRFCRGVIGLR